MRHKPIGRIVLVVAKRVGLRLPSLKCQMQTVLEPRHLHEGILHRVDITANVLFKIKARFCALYSLGTQGQVHRRHQSKYSLGASSPQLNKIVALSNVKKVSMSNCETQSGKSFSATSFCGTTTAVMVSGKV